MGLEIFGENELDKKEIEEMAILFVEEGISYTKFKAKSKEEMELFLRKYKEVLKEKTGTYIEEEDKEIKLAAWNRRKSIFLLLEYYFYI